MLDFGLANFLDRIAYKNPKSAEKLAKLRNSQRMAASEQPINTFDFKSNLPMQEREEEQYLYKYFKERPEKASKKLNEIDVDDFDGEDPELEKYADELMEKEMKRI